MSKNAVKASRPVQNQQNEERSQRGDQVQVNIICPFVSFIRLDLHDFKCMRTSNYSLVTVIFIQNEVPSFPSIHYIHFEV